MSKSGSPSSANPNLNRNFALMLIGPNLVKIGQHVRAFFINKTKSRACYADKRPGLLLRKQIGQVGTKVG